MSRFAGRSAEKRFSMLCSDVGVTCNPASEDDHGWDHVIHFPNEPVPGVAADLQAGLPAIFVQTKSQVGARPKIRMKLSNALALVRSPNPCFAILHSRRRAGELPRWYALHIWENQMSQVLRRAREAARDGTPESDFHKQYVTFAVDAADQRASDELLEWIKAEVVRAGPNYAAAKNALFENVGFGDARLVGSIQFEPMKSVEALIDHQLGLTPTIPIKKFELHDRRFGIDIKIPIPEGSAMIATLHALPSAECQVRLETPDGFLIEMEGELITSSLPGLPLDQCKVRVKTKLLDMVLSLGAATKFTVSFTTSQRMHVKELYDLTRLMSYAGKGDIDCQVWANDRRLFGGKLQIGKRRDRAAFERLARLIDTLQDLSRHLRIKRPLISIDDVSDGEERLGLLQAFLSSKTISSALTIDPSEFPPVETVDHAVFYGLAEIGAWTFGVLTEWRITDRSLDGTRWKLKYDRMKIVERYAFEASDAPAQRAVQADFERALSQPGALALNEDFLDALTRPSPTPQVVAIRHTPLSA